MEKERDRVYRKKAVIGAAVLCMMALGVEVAHAKKHVAAPQRDPLAAAPRITPPPYSPIQMAAVGTHLPDGVFGTDHITTPSVTATGGGISLTEALAEAVAVAQVPAAQLGARFALYSDGGSVADRPVYIVSLDGQCIPDYSGMVAGCFKGTEYWFIDAQTGQNLGTVFANDPEYAKGGIVVQVPSS
jgi:hypothetical protein